MSPVSRRTILKTLGAGGALLVGGVSFAGAQMDGEETALFRVGHFSPDTPEVNVLIDDEPFPDLQGVPFGALSPYFAVPAGEYNVKVVLAGEMMGDGETSNETETEMTSTETMTPADEAAVAIDADLSLTAGVAYTVIAADEFDNITAVVLEDDIEPASDSEAKVRVGHFSPDAPAVDIAVVDGPDIVTDLEFGDVSAYATLDEGSYDIEILVAESGETVTELSDVELSGGQVYSVFAIGYAAPQEPDLPGLSVLASNDSEAAAMAEGETMTTGTETTTAPS